jgi:hypothetical protein
MDLSNFFPAAPSYLPGLLGEEQARLAQRQAQQQGLLGAALGLMQAGAPSRTPISTGQALAQGLAAGQQAYGNVLQQRTQEALISQQLAEQQRKLQQQQAMRQLFPTIFQTTTERGAMAGEEGPIPTAQQRISIDPQRLSLLAAMSSDPFGALSNIAKTIPELRRAGLTAGGMEGADPFAPFMASENPNIRTVAAQYSRAYQSGAIDEATAGQRAESLAKMVESAAKPSTARANYDFAMAQRRERGEPTVPFEQWNIEQERAKAIQVNMPQEREKKLFGEVDVERVKEFSTAASASRNFAQTAEAINALLAGKGGGEVVRIGTDIQRALGIQNETVSAQDLAKALGVRAATTVRAPGSGSTSNIEFNAYMQAIPTLQNSQEGRALMTSYARARASRDAKLADYARGLARKDEYSEEAMARYDESLGPVMNESMQRMFVTLTTPTSQPSVAPGQRDFRRQ